MKHLIWWKRRRKFGCSRHCPPHSKSINSLHSQRRELNWFIELRMGGAALTAPFINSFHLIPLISIKFHQISKPLMNFRSDSYTVIILFHSFHFNQTSWMKWKQFKRNLFLFVLLEWNESWLIDGLLLPPLKKSKLFFILRDKRL